MWVEYIVVLNKNASFLFISALVAVENTAKFLSNPIFHNIGAEFCDPKPGVIMACVIREFFHNCPADRWAKTEECNTVLEFSKKCKDALTTI